MELREWLLDNDCPIVAMESMGVVLGPRKAIVAIATQSAESNLCNHKEWRRV